MRSPHVHFGVDYYEVETVFFLFGFVFPQGLTKFGADSEHLHVVCPKLWAEGPPWKSQSSPLGSPQHKLRAFAVQPGSFLKGAKSA